MLFITVTLFRAYFADNEPREKRTGRFGLIGVLTSFSLFVGPSLGGEVANLISKVTDTRVVYVSCDPATLARDLEVLLAAGFRGVDLRIFDMMPMTAEVEVVAILDRARPRETPRDD